MRGQLVCLGAEYDVVAACAGGEQTYRGDETVGTASVIALDARNSWDKEEAVRGATVRHLLK